MSPDLYREETPIEAYSVASTPVFVKRDDRYGRAPAPPLGKLRGLRVVLKDLYDQGQRLVGCWDTRVSRLGHGLAAACHEFPGLHAIVSYPHLKGGAIPAPILAAEKLGATVLPLRGNHVSICFAQARKRIEASGGRMLPFGLECVEAVVAVAREAARIPPELAGGTVLLCCGSGVTLAGLINGLPVTPSRIIGLSSGRSEVRIRACVGRYVPKVPSTLQIVPASIPYNCVPALDCPFPSHPNYDLKAWQFLCQHVEKLTKPILFWNIGA